MPQKSSQFISVGIPTYNSSKYVESCLKSVANKKMINQIIISDDCSTDEELVSLKKIISKFENNSNKEIIFSKNQKNLGGFHNKLKLIKKSKNDFIYILDSDNIAGKNLDSVILEILKKPDSNKYLYQPNTMCQFYNYPKLAKFMSNFQKKYKVKFLKDDKALNFNDIRNSLILNPGSYDISQFIKDDFTLTTEPDSDFLIDKWIFWLLNCGNFIVSKNEMIEILDKKPSFSRDLLSIDAVVFAYHWLSSGKAIQILESFYHHHRKRKDSVSFIEKENSTYATEYFIREILNS